MTAPEIRSANDDVPWRRRRACWWMKNLGSRIALQWYFFCLQIFALTPVNVGVSIVTMMLISTSVVVPYQRLSRRTGG